MKLIEDRRQHCSEQMIFHSSCNNNKEKKDIDSQAVKEQHKGGQREKI